MCQVLEHGGQKPAVNKTRHMTSLLYASINHRFSGAGTELISSRKSSNYMLYSQFITLRMIQSLLWRLATIPVQAKFVLRIWVWHLVESIVSPPLSLLPCLLHRRHAFALQTSRSICNSLPYTNDVLAGDQGNFFFSRSAIENCLQQCRETRTVFKPGDDRRDAWRFGKYMRSMSQLISTYHQSQTLGRRVSNQCGRRCRRGDLEACPSSLQIFYC